MALSRQDLIVAGCVALFSWVVLTSIYSDLRFVPYAFSAGFLGAIVVLLYVFAVTSRSIRYGKQSLSSPATFLAFSSTEAWTSELRSLKARSTHQSARVYSGSPAISGRFDTLIDWFLRDFLKSWYIKISSGAIFTNGVDRAVRIAIQGILDRALEKDLVEVAVTRLLPLLNNHIKAFSEAELLIRGRNLTLEVTEIEELDLAIATKYRDGKVHPAVSLAATKTSALQQQHVRRMAGRLVAELLPDDMTTSASVLVLIREILSCAVLVPVLQMLADPDTLNQIIEAYGRSVLYERKTVRKLREALDQHATPTRAISKPDAFLKLSPNDSERNFEQFIRAIKQCNSLPDARRYRSEILRQQKRDSALPVQDSTYLGRLEVGIKLLDQRIGQLLAAQSRQPSQNTSNSLQSNGSRSVYSKRENASLQDVLYDASGLSYFMEFMDRLHIMAFVQFWIVVDSMRSPLDQDLGKVDSSQSWNEGDKQDIISISQAYLAKPELKIAKASRAAVRQFHEAGSNATWQQYVAARLAILCAQEGVFKDMTTHFPDFKRSDLYFKWLTSDNNDDSSTGVVNGNSLEKHDFMVSMAHPRRESTHSPVARLKQHDLRRAVASSSDLLKSARESERSSEARRSLDDNSARPPLFGDENDDPLALSTQSLDSDAESLSRKEGDQVRIVAAVQAALDDIVDQGHEPDGDSLFSIPPNDERLDLDIPHVSFEDPQSGAGSPCSTRDKPSLASLGLVGTPSRRSVFSEGDLFGESEKLWEEDGEATDGNEIQADDDIHEAAPGDLGLAELVQSLSLDIKKLEAQESVVEALTNKAELTNNAAELRILRKSKSSLEREIHRKELQRQQYIVQQSENDLYGRATISIKKIMIGSEEDGHEFALYVIEVQRQAREKAPAVTWAIAKRYSEFHDLHKRLRSRYPSLKELDFPRRQIVLTLQKDFLKKRRAALERYLRELLTKPAICRSIEFRAFLSQQAIRPIADNSGKQIDRQDFITRIYNSVTDGMEEFLGNVPVLDQLSVAGQNLISAATALPNAQKKGVLPYMPSNIANDPTTAAEAEAEMTAFETTRNPETTSFIKPICDTFLELFQLYQGHSWLRGRAVVVVLQQLLGGTIERKVRETFKSFTAEDSVLKYMDMLRDILWPSGKFRASPPVRTEAERTKSRREAGFVLATLLPDLAGGVVGTGNAAKAGRRIFATLNNERLNQHLVYTMLDEIVDAVFGVRVTK